MFRIFTRPSRRPSKRKVAAGSPWDIVSGPDGNLWFTEYDRYAIGRLALDGTVTEYHLPTTAEGRASMGTYNITRGPDDNIWFTRLGATDEKGDRIDRGAIGRLVVK
jgi:streptogramin lyase